MEWTGIAGLITAAAAMIGVVIQAWQQHQKAERDAKVADAANAINGYSQLCDDLWAQLTGLRSDQQSLREELAKSQSRIAELERLLAETNELHAKERLAWEKERAELQSKVTRMERRLRELKANEGEA
jgi:peptidoglycan hydrolase CwlO-like protein